MDWLASRQIRNNKRKRRKVLFLFDLDVSFPIGCVITLLIDFRLTVVSCNPDVISDNSSDRSTPLSNPTPEGKVVNEH